MSTTLTRLLAFILILPLMTTAACKDGPSVVATADGKSSVTVAPGGETAETPPEDSSVGADSLLPAFAPAYPGARLKTRIGNEKDGNRGSLMVFVSDDSVEKIAAFYDARAKEAGVTPSMFVNEADSAVRIFGGPDGEHRKGGALIAISRADEGNGTEIVITSGMAPAEVARMEKDEGWREGARPAIRLQ